MIKFIFICLLGLLLGYLFATPLANLLSLFNANSSSFFNLLSTPLQILNNFLNTIFSYSYISLIISWFIVIAVFFYILNSVFRGEE